MDNQPRKSPSARAQAMILAAGRGERMRPLTDHTPKPLLQVNDKSLIAWHLEHLGRDGIERVLINTGWLGHQLPGQLGPGYCTAQGRRLTIIYSREELDFDSSALETAGGIARALPWLEPVFWLMAGDIYAPAFRFDPRERDAFEKSPALAHIWLVPNPAHNSAGDFVLAGHQVREKPAHTDGSPVQPSYTYSTIGLFRQQLFQPPWCDIPPGNPAGLRLALGPVLRKAARAGRVTASLFEGDWSDIGTPLRLQQLQQTLTRQTLPDQE